MPQDAVSAAALFAVRGEPAVLRKGTKDPGNDVISSGCSEYYKQVPSASS